MNCWGPGASGDASCTSLSALHFHPSAAPTAGQLPAGACAEGIGRLTRRGAASAGRRTRTCRAAAVERTRPRKHSSVMRNRVTPCLSVFRCRRGRTDAGQRADAGDQCGQGRGKGDSPIFVGRNWTVGRIDCRRSSAKRGKSQSPAQRPPSGRRAGGRGRRGGPPRPPRGPLCGGLPLRRRNLQLQALGAGPAERGTGQASQRGMRGRQTSLPSSISAWLKRPAPRRGRRASARAQPSRCPAAEAASPG